mmetsp:Transcript_53245/g.142469  ORF Transcript_53245/g.142469 Transcript_53245/m.142469 type:complete len:234 (-) Transcript_53245:310-1011(-)
MLQQPLRARPLHGVVLQTSANQVDTQLPQGNTSTFYAFKMRVLPLRKLGGKVPQLRDTRPNIIVGSAEETENLEDRVDLRVAWKQRRPSSHLGQDTPQGPYVDRRKVSRLANQNFRSAVPQSHNVVRVSTQGYAKCPREPEICKFQFHRFHVKQNVLWFQVAMQDTTPVTVCNATEALQCRIPQLLGVCNGAKTPDVLSEVHVQVLKHKIHRRRITVHSVKLNDVRVTAFFQE